MRLLHTLRDEHEAILQALDALDTRTQRLEAGEETPVSDLQTLVRFFRRYADACHHAKEEKVLFPALLQAGMLREGGPIGVMLHEHGVGREHITVMDSHASRVATDPEARSMFTAAATSFSSMLRHHIHKENNVLFVMADRMLESSRDTELHELGARQEAETIGSGEKDELLAALRRLS